ncbi:separin (caspase fold protease) [Cryptosporidium canis]|uniref:separase n=1 Tax=Cryptosporidium canis TaxID=195482 RepID=A0ABQ8P7V5_9CRYT|nr:separin (caspase fold protease) [Cryptosporidium canis]
MDNNIHESLSKESSNNRLEGLLIHYLGLLYNRVHAVFFEEKKHASFESKFRENGDLADCFENINGFFENATNLEITNAVKKCLMDNIDISQFEKLFQISTNQVIKYFSDIYRIYGFITAVCIELKCTKVLIHYLILSHNILPCFIVGDLLFLKKNTMREWNTEKILISSMAKLSREFFKNLDSRILNKKLKELYYSWSICLDNLMEYLKIRLTVINLVKQNSEEILGLAKFIKEIFQLVSKSNMPCHYQALIVINCCNSLRINMISYQSQKSSGDSSLINVNLPSVTVEHGVWSENINLLFNKILELRSHKTIIDLVTILNGLSTLLINIVHQGMKRLYSQEPNSSLNLYDFHEIPIKSYSINFKIDKGKILIAELHYLKAYLCLMNQFLIKKVLINSHCMINESERKVFNQKYRNIMISYLFLTLGVISSFTKVEFDGHLIHILDSLLDSQCFILMNMREEKWPYDNTFLKNMDSYRSTLLEYTTKQLFFMANKDIRYQTICKSCIDKILEILTTFLEIKKEQLRFDKKDDIQINNKMDIKFKTSVCEVVLRSIQYNNGILDDLYIKMEETIHQILDMECTEDGSNIDEVILNFLLSVSENLIRLSSQLKSIKKYQDSIRLLTLSLKCLTKILTVPWIANDYSIHEIERNMEKLNIIQESPNDGTSDHLYSTPSRKYNNMKQVNTVLNNNLLCLTNNRMNTCARFWKNENLEYGSHEMNNYGESDEIRPVNSFLPNTSVKFRNLATPFTQRLKSKGLSQMQSQTIKRIQASAFAYISKRSKYNKIEDIEILKLDKKLKDGCELDFPLHILLFLMALEQIVSSTQLQFLQEPSESSLDHLLLLIEENISTFFSIVDYRSYSFIFRNKLTELFPFIGDITKVFNFPMDEQFEFTSDDCEKLIRDHFFNLFSSIVKRFAKIKTILIYEYSSNETILYRYPIIKGERDYMVRILWFYLELNYYINNRELSNKYEHALLKKGTSNSFCANVVNIYNNINKFIDERTTKHSITFTKSSFEQYFSFKYELLNYYVWFAKIINNIQDESSDLIYLKTTYINQIEEIMDELTLFINEINSDYKFIYLMKINILRFHLLCFIESESNSRALKAKNLLKEKGNQIDDCLEQSVNSLYRYIGIYESYGKCFNKILNLDHWACDKHTDNVFRITKTPDFEDEHAISEPEDVPIPINTKLERPINAGNGTNKIEFLQEINSVRFAEDNLGGKQISLDILKQMNSQELGIIFFSTFEMCEVHKLQNMDSSVWRKWLAAIIYLFSSCWVFILNDKENADKEDLSKKIYYYLDKITHSFNISLGNEHREIFTLNFGLFISNILSYLTQDIQNDVHSKISISGWSNITHIYLDGLLYLIESKYLLSSDFFDDKVTVPLPIIDILFNLIVLKVELTDELFEASQLLQIINKIGVNQIGRDSQFNTGLFIKLFNKLSILYMNANKPDLSLFYSLEANKYTKMTISWLESCSLTTLHSQFDLFSSCITPSFQLYFLNLLIESLFQLGKNWWRMGVIERSQSVYNKLLVTYKKWKISHKKLLIFYFYQLPILLNHLFSRSDSKFNLVFSADNIYLLKQVLSGGSYNVENSSQIFFLKDILEFTRLSSEFENLSYLEEEVILMIILFILVYFTLNDILTVIEDYLISSFPIINGYTSHLRNNGDSKIIIHLRKIINQILSHELNSINLISELLSLSYINDTKTKHFNFFSCNTINYVLLFISSYYVDIVGNYFNMRYKDPSISLICMRDKNEVEKKLQSFKKNTIEYTIKEICSIIVLIKQMLCIELTPLETYLNSEEPNSSLQRSDEHLFSFKSHSFRKCEQELINTLCEKNSSNKNRLWLFKRILTFVNVIFKHILINEKMNYYLLNQLSISIILDIILLMKALCYQDNTWNNIFCCFVDSLTPISIFSDYSFSVIHTIRKVQKRFEMYKVKDKNTTINGNFQFLLKFFLENEADYSSEWMWGDNISNRDINDYISIVFIRFSTIFANSSLRGSNNSKFSLLQITKDFSSEHNFFETTPNEFIFNSSKLTFFYFIDNSQVNKLLEEFDTIQSLNTESILGIDIDTNSTDQVRKWWNRRIKIEAMLNDWLIKFSNILLNGWMIKLLYGRHKDLCSKENIKLLSAFVNSYLIGVAPSLIEVVLFSLINNVPQLINLLNSNNITNICFTDLLNHFKKIKLRRNRGKVESFPTVAFLDKIFVCLPIEGSLDLRFQPITRGIDISFCKANMDYLFNQLHTYKNSSRFLAEFCNLYYCINPTGDLEETEKTVLPFIRRLFGSKCSGISNSIPNATSIMNNISIDKSNLYLFCGHQAGEKFMQGEEFERGIATECLDSDEHFHLPPSLLIGCSSSKIRSYGSNNIFFTPMHYIIGGSPFVLGALWDVTDQDIDRFTMSIFDNWVGSELSLIESITLAKQECKLPLLNGSSCVCFGYPI